MSRLINASGRLFRTACVLSAILTSVAWTVSCSAQDVTPAAAGPKDVAGESPPYIVLNDAESLDRWAAIGAMDKLTLRDEHKEGKKAIGLKKTETTQDYVRCSLTLAEPLDLSDTGRFSCWLYIADPKPINKISLWLGNTERWHNGFLLVLPKPWKAGWNHIDVSLLQFGQFTKKADWSDIKIFSIEITTYNPTDTYGDFLIDDLRLWPVKDFVAPSPEPKQQDNPYAMADGKPFFPVGVYGFPYDAPDAEWREAASLGINMVCPDNILTIPQWLAFLDKAHEHGIKVVCGLIYPAKDVWSSWWATDLNENTFRNIARPKKRRRTCGRSSRP